MAELLINDGSNDPVFDRPGRAALGMEVPHADAVSWDEGIMTSALFDFDLDGWLDVYLGMSDYAGNHGLLYHQDSALSFTQVPIDQGIDHHRSHGIAIADFDRDGDLDVVVGHSHARCDASAPDDCYPTQQVRFFENVAGDGGNWVQLHLEGTDDVNAVAIGARATLTAGGVTQTREVEGGHGHYGAQSDLLLTFGLGAECEADVTVRWPNGALATDTFHVTSGHRYTVTPGRLPRVEE